MNWYIKHQSNGHSIMADEVHGHTVAVFYSHDEAEKMMAIIDKIEADERIEHKAPKEPVFKAEDVKTINILDKYEVLQAHEDALVMCKVSDIKHLHDKIRENDMVAMMYYKKALAYREILKKQDTTNQAKVDSIWNGLV